MENSKYKRYYIYENIHKINNHNQFIELMNQNNCKYTENNNGIFINLNTLNDEVIQKMYQIMLNISMMENLFSKLIKK